MNSFGLNYGLDLYCGSILVVAVIAWVAVIVKHLLQWVTR